jgi:hypothetical protein
MDGCSARCRCICPRACLGLSLSPAEDPCPTLTMSSLSGLHAVKDVIQDGLVQPAARRLLCHRARGVPPSLMEEYISHRPSGEYLS